ncbi:Remorin [Quillaja saponaria]|uniref:Remorin n=1 Tax=Quillaja saponaria TaxID=32244 RepID=A0AAD7P7P3_QUISA|nr:Remorin [Quillaja saponaria]
MGEEKAIKVVFKEPQVQQPENEAAQEKSVTPQPEEKAAPEPVEGKCFNVLYLFLSISFSLSVCVFFLTLTLAEEAEPMPGAKPVDRGPLTRVMTEKNLAFVNAWEEAEKTKANNK